jgi:hypothetical protein
MPSHGGAMPYIPEICLDMDRPLLFMEFQAAPIIWSESLRHAVIGDLGLAYQSQGAANSPLNKIF